MKTKPIIFSGPMIVALLEGRKTQTRRVLKPQPFPVGGPFYQPSPTTYPHHWHSVSQSGHIANIQRLPYAKGMLLWVRERFTYLLCQQCDLGQPPSASRPCICGTRKKIAYHEGQGPGVNVKWHPSIHMPRWASRLTLEVTDVRVQRLIDISEEDVRAEGIAELSKDDGRTWKWGLPDQDGWPGTDDHGEPWSDWTTCPQDAFARLWNKIHGPGAWDQNPWVAAYTFTVHHRNVDDLLAEREVAA